MSPRLLLSIVVLAVALAACGGAEATPTPTPTTTVPEINVTSAVVTEANFPVALAFAPDGRLFFTEFPTGNIRIYADGQTSTFAQVDILSVGQCGLIGLALDPDFAENHYVYVSYVEPVDSRDDVGHPVVMRLTEVDGQGEDATVLVGDMPNTNPAACVHVIENLHFGPDGYLYVAIGELEYKDPSQNLGSPLGKILRIDKMDGSGAPDNPFVNERGADPRVFAYGLRNPFDFVFHPESGRLYETENGPSNCDEINIIVAGENYGHPMSYSDAAEPPCVERAGVTPIYLPARPGARAEEWGSNVAPTGIHFVSGEVYPSLGDALLYCEHNTGFMRRLILTGPSLDRVVDDRVVVEDCYLDITTDSEGTVYYSNQREIRRLVPGE